MFGVELSIEPMYAALSYEWGGIGGCSVIWIDGGFCRVGSSLFNALIPKAPLVPYTFDSPTSIIVPWG
jgi:hypothetical protein